MATRKKSIKKSAPKKRRSSSTVSTSSASFQSLVSAARKAGFKRKKPKKPKTKTLASLENFVRKTAEWSRDVRKAAADHKRFVRLKEKVSKM